MLQTHQRYPPDWLLRLAIRREEREGERVKGRVQTEKQIEVGGARGRKEIGVGGKEGGREE